MSKNSIKNTIRLALAAMFMPVVGFAQGAFPYFGPIVRQEVIISQGFLHAWGIIQQVSSPGGALFFLALTGALVGTFLLITRPSMRSPVNLFSWLVIVLVLLITPVSSRLLFTEVDVLDVNTATLAAPTSATQVPAFVPQAVALHVMSTIHEILLTYFNGAGFKDRLGEVLAQRQLCAADFKLPDDLAQQINEFNADPACAGVPVAPSDLQDDIREANGLPGTPPNNVNIGNQFTFDTYGNVINEINRYYTNNNDFSVPPPAMLLLRDGFPASFDNEQRVAYEKGLRQLYETLNSGNTVNIDLSQTSVGSSANPAFLTSLVDGVIASLPSNFSCNTLSPSACGPGLGLRFFLTENAGAGGQLAAPANDPALIGRLQPTTGATAPYADQDSFFNRSANQEILFDSGSGLDDIFNMPVAVARISADNTSLVTSTDCSDRANELGVKLGDIALGQGIKQSFRDSIVRDRNPLPDSVGTSALGNGIRQTGSAFGTIDFRQLLLTDGAGALGSFIEQNARDADKAQRTAEFYNKIKQNNPNLTDEQIRARLFANFAVCASRQSSRSLPVNSTQDPRTNASVPSGSNLEGLAEQAFTPSVLRGLFDTQFGQDIVFLGVSLTSVLLEIFTYIVGFLSIVTIQFLKVLINITLMGIIVVTPFMMLMGLVIPSYAFGVLVFTTVSLAVLKMVPITFLIVDTVLSLLFEIWGGIS